MTRVAHATPSGEREVSWPAGQRRAIRPAGTGAPRRASSAGERRPHVLHRSVRPVISVTWPTAWCSSMAYSLTAVPPAGQDGAGQRGRPRVVDHVQHHGPRRPARARVGVGGAAGHRRDDDVGGRHGHVGHPADHDRLHAEPLGRRPDLAGPSRIAHQHDDLEVAGASAEFSERGDRGLRGAAGAEDHRAARVAKTGLPQRLGDAAHVGVVQRCPPVRRQHDGVRGARSPGRGG